MLGAIIGDIVGSRFEFHNHRNKDFELFTDRCHPTDDSVMTLTVAKAIIEAEKIKEPSIGGYGYDGDTLAAITGSIAEAYYGIPFQMGSGLQYCQEHKEVIA